MDLALPPEMTSSKAATCFCLLGLIGILNYAMGIPLEPEVRPVCPPRHFRCASGGGCLAAHLQCDKHPDCADNSDEDLCFQDKHQDAFWNAFFQKRPDADRPAPASKKEGDVEDDVTRVFEVKGKRLDVQKEVESTTEVDFGRPVQLVASRCVLGAVPQGCVCGAGSRVICANAALPSVPRGLPSDVTVLDLSSNAIRSLGEEDFRNLTELRELLMMNSSLKTIGSRTFYHCLKLQKLYLYNNLLEEIPSDAFPENNVVEELQLSMNRLRILTPDFFSTLHRLRTLRMDLNIIENILPNTFLPMRSLSNLFLDKNNIDKIDFHYFANMSGLRQLSLASNRVSRIASLAFLSLGDLQSLSLSGNLIRKIYPDSFHGLINLTFLDLKENQIMWIDDRTFDPLVNLKSLDLRKNNFNDIPRGTLDTLKRLQFVYFDHFYLCAAAPTVAKCLPWGDGISSTSDLLANPVLRGAAWLVAICACVGNMAVLLGRHYVRASNVVHSLLIRGLAMADLLMGVYLLLIAAHDLRFRSEYLRYDQSWRNSWSCDACGVLATLSSEASVLTLTLITLDRYLCVTHPLALRPRSMRLAVGLLCAVWVTCLMLALLPVLGLPYFGRNFYRDNAVCIPLHLHEPRVAGWEYSTFLFIGLNLSAFVFIAFAYTSMMSAIRRSAAMARSRDVLLRSRDSRIHDDRCLVQRFLLIVVSDMLCWLPVIGLKVAALAGAEIGGDLYGWVVVFVLPVNSALNPLLYTLTTYVFTSSCFSKQPTLDRCSLDSQSLTSLKSRHHSQNTQDIEMELLPTVSRAGASSSNTYTGRMKYKYSHGVVLFPDRTPHRLVNTRPTTS